MNELIFYSIIPLLYLILTIYLYNTSIFVFKLSLIYPIILIFFTLFINLPDNRSSEIIKVKNIEDFLFKYWIWFNIPLNIFLLI